MCGIAGYISLQPQNWKTIEEKLLEAMLKKMVHRGPDGKGNWISQNYGIGFAHQRLSLLDISSAGSQPMTSPDGLVTVIFNGEIYNHLEVRKKLEELGYVYRSTTDTETLLYAFHAWGIECLKKLNGEFAFVIFDQRTNEIFCVRDRMGVKPLYFAEKEGWFSFASEIKALWSLPWLEKKINQQGLYHYLTFMVTPAPFSLYEGVYKLPAGYYAKIDAQRSVTFHEWYNPLANFSHDEYVRAYNEQYCIEKIQTLLRDSIHSRMIADVPIGVLLSGGVDSTAITALMAEHSSKIKTFTVSFSDGPEYSELEWARKVSKLYGTDHHEIIISEKEAFSIFDTMTYYQDEPVADCVCVPLYYVTKLAHEHDIRAVLVGEGSDELFCGYSTYAQILSLETLWRRSSRFIPSWIRKKIYQSAQRTSFKFKERIDMVYDWAHDRSLFWGGALAFREHSKKRLYDYLPSYENDEMVERIYSGLNQHNDSYAFVDYHLKQFKKYNSANDLLLKMIYLELKQRLPELLLMRVDKMTMAHSIESRVPFLDYRLVEFALHIPAHLKFKNNQTKYILKKALEGIVPHDVIYRKKMGFAAPTTRWFRSNSYFRNCIESDLAKLSQNHDFNFNFSTLLTLSTKHFLNKQDYSVQLWTLKNFFSTISDETV